MKQYIQNFLMYDVCAFNYLYLFDTFCRHLHDSYILWPILDWIDSHTLYIGRVQFLFLVCQAVWYRYSTRKMAKLFATSGDPDQMLHSALSGLSSALLANHPFRGLQTEMGKYTLMTDILSKIKY